MIQKIQDVGELVRTSRFVDCYVTTETREVTDMLEANGFIYHPSLNSNGYPDQTILLTKDYAFHKEIFPVRFRHMKSPLEVDVVDVPLKEALEMDPKIGFTPMGRMRFYATKNQGTDGHRALIHGAEGYLVAFAKEGKERRLNFAFLDESGATAVVFHFESYL